MATLAQYLAHAQNYGGFDSIWQAAWGDLSAIQLGEEVVRVLVEL